MNKYQKPLELYEGLRLHQNENTGGCSPRVLDALASIRADQVSFYPPYEAATAKCARYLGVDPDNLSLVNGLDEGIMALAVAQLRPPAAGRSAEAIIPEPAFEIFRFDTIVAGGVVVPVAPKPDFTFALDDVLEAITDATRVVFLTNPNNPTGVSMPLDAIPTIANRVPPGAIVFVDEAYAEFSGETFMDVLTQQCTDPPTPPRAMAPNAPISEELEQAILRALEKDVERRFQSMRELAEAIAAVPTVAVPRATASRAITAAQPEPDLASVKGPYVVAIATLCFVILVLSIALAIVVLAP